jgi:hypothetical protein
VIRGERLVFSIPAVILIPQSREKNLGLNLELIHHQKYDQGYFASLNMTTLC